jgi:hypothetical protein
VTVGIATFPECVRAGEAALCLAVLADQSRRDTLERGELWAGTVGGECGTGLGSCGGRSAV